jgi:hypothetical protein
LNISEGSEMDSNDLVSYSEIEEVVECARKAGLAEK